MNTTLDTCLSGQYRLKQWLVNTDKSAQDDCSHYDRSHILLVNCGQIIAHIAPAAEDTPDPFTLGSGIELTSDAQSLRATITGQLYRQDGRIWVEDELKIGGDVDFSTGNINFSGNVIIGGGVADLFQVNAKGSIRIAGSVGAAEINAGGDLITSAGILGNGKGRCTAGGLLQCTHASSAALYSGQDVIARRELFGCQVFSSGAVRVEAGALMGGEAVAAGGINCRVLGSVSGSPTIVCAGQDPALAQLARERLPALEAQRQKLQQTRQSVESFLKNAKMLSPAQKEKATEILYEVAQQEAVIQKDLAALHRDWKTSQDRSRSEIRVERMLHAGVTIRFPGLQATTTTDQRGPMRIVPKGADQVALISDFGATRLLAARPFVDPLIQSLSKALNLEK
ncbi:MAG: DUF342 domain-containing protein [Phycisphaerales bacterium]|nr:DUF342 domain-containing protein [Phycisphaerales bacterium]